MTNLKIIKGNIFTSTANVLVNTVNCVGVMGAGIALEFRLRYPNMFLEYVALCKSHQINIGSLWLYKSEKKWIKDNWRNFIKSNHNLKSEL